MEVQAVTSQATQQSQKRLTKAQQRLEVGPVQHQHQAETVPELRPPQPAIRLRMLENDGK